MNLALLTPTGSRPEAFALCEQWMSRQTFKGGIQWLCADDGAPPTVFTKGQAVVRREPSSGISLADNLLALLPLVEGDRVAVIEDDDYYAPGYLESMMAMLENSDIAGEMNAGYFNVVSRRWFMSQSQWHASLCRTVFRLELLPLFAKACLDSKAAGDPFIDQRFWTLARPLRVNLCPWTKLSVGIKGMPGRHGAGKSHGWNAFQGRDPQLTRLHDWIGADAEEYARFADPKKVSQ